MSKKCSYTDILYVDMYSKCQIAWGYSKYTEQTESPYTKPENTTHQSPLTLTLTSLPGSACWDCPNSPPRRNHEFMNTRVREHQSWWTSEYVSVRSTWTSEYVNVNSTWTSVSMVGCVVRTIETVNQWMSVPSMVFCTYCWNVIMYVLLDMIMRYEWWDMKYMTMTNASNRRTRC